MTKAARGVFAGAIALLAIPLLGAAAPGSQPLGATLAQRAPQKMYASTCGYCHGVNVGPVILGRHLPADYVRQMVRGGRNAMPAFRPTEISPAELDQLAQWVSAAPANPQEKGQ